MSGCSPPGNEPAPHASAFYRRALMALQAAQVPFLVGGGYALAHYAGIIRHTKDFDIFVYPHHCAHALDGSPRHRVLHGPDLPALAW